MHDVMEPPVRSSLTFITSEASDTPASKRNKKRMFGGADVGDNSITNRPSSRISDSSGSPAVINNAKKNIEQSRFSTGNNQANAPDNLRTLNGGELTKLYPSTSSLIGKERESSKKRSLDDNGKICFCASHSGRSNGEKRIDEMMEYAIQNLSEAGKALTNLGDNFEHDLRLMFMDIMGRVQHWVSVVENRIHAARADLESLRKESIARVSDQSAKDMEIIALRRKLEETEAELDAERKQRIETAAAGSDQVSLAERVSTSIQTTNDKDQEDRVRSQSVICSVNRGCQSETNREETASREAELEAELTRVIEENDRIMKEHAEYESAIHCALLKGVSSLNIEAFKVLRHPLIPCCTPCSLSTPCSSSLEPVVLCRPRATRCEVAVPQPVQRGSKDERCDKIISKNRVTRNNCCQRLSEHSLYCSRGNERSEENSMLFLLHHGDAGNQCQPSVQARCRPNGNPSNKGNVCVGGKTRKLTTTCTKERISSATKPPGSRQASYDLCVRNRDDSRENCTTAGKNTSITKRCSASSGSRCNKDN